MLESDEESGQSSHALLLFPFRIAEATGTPIERKYDLQMDIVFSNLKHRTRLNREIVRDRDPDKAINHETWNRT